MKFCHLTLNFALSVDDALCAGMAGVGLTVPAGSLWLAATPLIPNVARLAGTTSEGALVSQQDQGHHIIVFILAKLQTVATKVPVVFVHHERAQLSTAWKPPPDPTTPIMYCTQGVYIARLKVKPIK